jgi:hypothetical protein
LLRLVGPGRTVPDFSSLSHRHKTLAVNIACRGSQGPLHLPIPLLSHACLGSRCIFGVAMRIGQVRVAAGDGSSRSWSQRTVPE